MTAHRTSKPTRKAARRSSSTARPAPLRHEYEAMDYSRGAQTQAKPKAGGGAVRPMTRAEAGRLGAEARWGKRDAKPGKTSRSTPSPDRRSLEAELRRRSEGRYAPARDYDEVHEREMPREGGGHRWVDRRDDDPRYDDRRSMDPREPRMFRDPYAARRPEYGYEPGYRPRSRPEDYRDEGRYGYAAHEPMRHYDDRMPERRYREMPEYDDRRGRPMRGWDGEPSGLYRESSGPYRESSSPYRESSSPYREPSGPYREYGDDEAPRRGAGRSWDSRETEVPRGHPPGGGRVRSRSSAAAPKRLTASKSSGKPKVTRTRTSVSSAKPAAAKRTRAKKQS